MDLSEFADQVQTKEDFIIFLQLLQDDFFTNQDQWENQKLSNYLEAMEAYLTSSSEKSLTKVDFTPSWSLFANVMLVASIYE